MNTGLLGALGTAIVVDCIEIYLFIFASRPLAASPRVASSGFSEKAKTKLPLTASAEHCTVWPLLPYPRRGYRVEAPVRIYV